MKWKEIKEYIIATFLVLLFFITIISLSSAQYYKNRIVFLNQTWNKEKNDILEQLELQKERTTSVKKLLDVREKEIINLTNRIRILNNEIWNLNFQYNITKSNLEFTETQLGQTQMLLDIAENYQERVRQGTILSESYKLLGDYDKVKEIIVNKIGISTPTTEKEKWEIAKVMYDWLGTSYSYCSDKGFCVGEQCTQIQFFSPDELLIYGSQDVLCGDCDDKAHLFAGMLYASGIPHREVMVVCGYIPEGYHCWNRIFVNNRWYRIDPVCSNVGTLLLEHFGLDFLSEKAFPLNEYRDVDCFSSYEAKSGYTADGYYSNV